MRRWIGLLGLTLVAGLLVGCGNGAVTVEEAPGDDAPTGVVAQGDVAPTMEVPEAPLDAGGDPAPISESADAATAMVPTPMADAPPTANPTRVTPATFLTVTVQTGDTLLGLALEHEVPMAAIQLQNDLGTTTMVRLGQELVIPPGSAWEGASPFWIVHVVSEGETLSEIGQAYGLTVGQLQGANGLADVDLLGVGQTLVLPLTEFTVARAVDPPAPVAGAHPTAALVTEEDVAGAAATATIVPAEPDDAPAVQPAPPPDDVAAWPQETVRIMNEVRAAHNLPPLVYNETLARAAQVQANDCAARGSCSHTGSDGSTIKERILRVGYKPASWAECWAIRPTPQGAIDIWMDEVPPNDPHRRTLLTTWLTEIGVGVAETTWGYYFIADFGKPLR